MLAYPHGAAGPERRGPPRRRASRSGSRRAGTRADPRPNRSSSAGSSRAPFRWATSCAPSLGPSEGAPPRSDARDAPRLRVPRAGRGGVSRQPRLSAQTPAAHSYLATRAPRVHSRTLFGERRGHGVDEVAVVIPSRNRWQFLRTALASALAQRGVDVGVVVVDDGSIGRTPGELGALHDERVQVLRRERPEGVSAARNLGLVHVTAPWVAFLDDDDVWAPRHLSAMLDAVRVSELDPERVGLVFSGHLDVDAHAKSPTSRPPRRRRPSAEGSRA